MSGDQTIPRWHYFQTMGNNCRVTGLLTAEAEKLIDSRAQRMEDRNNFWFGFRKGTVNEFVPLPSLEDE